MRCENKPLLQDDPRFFQDITSTAVEVGLRCAIERAFRMVTRIEMLSATSILSSASGGIESDLSNESLHFFSVGTRRFSSSNQFSTTLICVGAEASCWFGLSIKKRWPSSEMS